jgi:hypothetical protein
LGALAYHGLDAIDAAEKEGMRELAMRGGPYTDAEQMALLDYCQTDVDSLARLLPVMLPKIDLPRALLRGRYMAAAARMEWAGVPIDRDCFDRLQTNWDPLKARLIARVNEQYGVYVPTDQRTIDPTTRLGAAILREAEASEVDPHQLAKAVEEVWREERVIHKDLFEAREKARKVTGLTPSRIDRWEDSGKDHSRYPGLDTMARELARELPLLGIGSGYSGAEGYDDSDYAGALWEQLRSQDERHKPRHHPDILRRAAELVHGGKGNPQNGSFTFSATRFASYLTQHEIPWPRLESGALALDDETFREMAKAYPAQIGPLRELRHTIGQMRLHSLAVGSDDRNRCLLSAFRSKTSRNQPSNTQFIFGPSAWLRSLIRPAPGRAVAYVDWSQQELAIAARLSGDLAMQTAYQSGDFYLTFAKMANAVPQDATKKSHGTIRDKFKIVSLGVLYGLGAESLARKLAVPKAEGRWLLRSHKEAFPTFWEWSDHIEMRGLLHGRLVSPFGWQVLAGSDANPRSLRNFPMQAAGADMMRLACCLATERGITVCCPVHDALLVEGDLDQIEEVVAEMQRAMREASELVLPGFPLKTEAKIVRYPDRYMDPRGEGMWATVVGILEEIEQEDADLLPQGQGGAPGGAGTCSPRSRRGRYLLVRYLVTLLKHI